MKAKDRDRMIVGQLRTSPLQSYRVLLYDRVLHPELFQLQDRHVVRHGRYEFEAWLMRGAHVLRFDVDGRAALELCTEHEEFLPDGGLLEVAECCVEHDFEKTFEPTGLTYMRSVQTETLNDNVFHATLKEMRELAAEEDGLLHEWDDEGPCLSLLSVQRYSREIHVQAYHLLSRENFVLRTQTLFEHV